MNILEQLRDPEILSTLSLGQKFWGAIVVTITGMVVCMVALTAILFAIKLMHAVFKEKTVPAAEGPAPESAPLPEFPAGSCGVLSPSAASVSALNAYEGASVREGDVLLLVRVGAAEYEIPAPCAGTVETLPVAVGDEVGENAVLAVIREKEDSAHA